MLLNCIIIKGEKSYTSLCLDVDVASEGLTIGEAKKNLIEAVNLYIDTAIESELPIIRTVPDDENPIKIEQEKITQKFLINLNLN